MKLSKIINRNPEDETDETFVEFLKKYWWIELLALFKVIYFVNEGYYGYSFGILFVIGALFVLWVLYRIGLE